MGTVVEFACQKGRVSDSDSNSGKMSHVASIYVITYGILGAILLAKLCFWTWWFLRRRRRVRLMAAAGLIVPARPLPPPYGTSTIVVTDHTVTGDQAKPYGSTLPTYPPPPSAGFISGQPELPPSYQSVVKGEAD